MEQASIQSLPEELLHLVFDNATESILALKMACKSLGGAVDSYVRRSKAVNMITKMDVIFEEAPHRLLPAHTRIMVTVSDQRRHLFGMRVNEYIFEKGIARTAIQRIPSVQPGHLQYCTAFKHGDEFSEFLLTCINECMGRLGKIGQVQLYPCNDRSRVDECVRILLNLVNVRKLVYEGPVSMTDISFILQLLRMHHVSELGLRVTETTLDDPNQVLLDLSARVRFLSIVQKFSRETIGCIFGLRTRSTDWANIIIGMFAEQGSKLDTLGIDCDEGINSLTPDRVDHLKKTLPTLGKNLWLEARFTPEQVEQDYINNGFSIQVTKKTLTIKHASRNGFLIMNNPEVASVYG